MQYQCFLVSIILSILTGFDAFAEAQLPSSTGNKKIHNVQKNCPQASSFNDDGQLASRFSTQSQKDNIVWDISLLSTKVPQTYPDEEWKSKGVKSLYYSGLNYQDRQTRVFAYIGLPENASKENPVPGVVCVHGGGGTAFAQWVRIWNERGYAAIAMDLEGQVPGKPDKQHQRPRHRWHGPRRAGVFNDIKEKTEDQWMYHAVANVIIANTLLRNIPEVNPDKVGLIGISWGGIISSIVVGVDQRFAFAIPIYGCGYLFESGNHYQERYKSMGTELSEKCKKLWDGSSYLRNAKMPMLWLIGTNDNHFYPTIFQKSYLDTQTHAALCIKPGLLHSHEYAWVNKEIYAFADSIVNNGTPLPRIIDTGRDNKFVWVKFSAQSMPAKVILNYTCDQGPQWPTKHWKQKDCSIDTANQTASTLLPDEADAYYFNVIDENHLVASSPITFRP